MVAWKTVNDLKEVMLDEEISWQMITPKVSNEKFNAYVAGYKSGMDALMAKLIEMGAIAKPLKVGPILRG